MPTEIDNLSDAQRLARLEAIIARTLDNDSAGLVMQLYEEVHRLQETVADMADELRISIPRFSTYRQREQVLLNLVVTAFGFTSPDQIKAHLPPMVRTSGPRLVVNNQPRAARYILFYLLRCEFPDLATRSRLKRDYGVRIEIDLLASGMSDLMVVAEYRRMYQKICAEYAKVAGYAPTWCPEPGLEQLRQAALRTQPVGGVGRPLSIA